MCFMNVKGKIVFGSEGLGLEDLKGAHLLNCSLSEEVRCCKSPLEKIFFFFFQKMGFVAWSGLFGQRALYNERSLGFFLFIKKGFMGGSFDASESFVSFLVPTLLALTNHSLFNDEALLEEMTRF